MDSVSAWFRSVETAAASSAASSRWGVMFSIVAAAAVVGLLIDKAMGIPFAFVAISAGLGLCVAALADSKLKLSQVTTVRQGLLRKYGRALNAHNAAV